MIPINYESLIAVLSNPSLSIDEFINMFYGFDDIYMKRALALLILSDINKYGLNGDKVIVLDNYLLINWGIR